MREVLVFIRIRNNNFFISRSALLGGVVQIRTEKGYGTQMVI
jgi:hypothetical protein